jgi:serine/threonine protein kinase
MGDVPAKMGPYRVVRRLGEGGMGTVFEGLHETIHRRVAIKVLRAELARDPDMANRFINEARAVNLVEHPGLVQVSDYGTLPNGVCYIVMEFLKGETLEARLKRCGGKLSTPYALQLGWQLADSLAAAHAKGIIHRDLKPSNVMLVADPHMQIGQRTKILDFGLVKLTESKGGAFVKTHSGAVLGTPLYMSPEQCEGPTQVDAKTDVYSLGAMLYEMLAGRQPFLGDSLAQVLAMHLFKEPEPLGALDPSLPAPLVELVHRALIKDRTKRPTMAELAQALEEMFSLAPPPSRHSLEVPADNSSDSEAALGLASTIDPLAAASQSADFQAQRSQDSAQVAGLRSTLGQAATQGRGPPSTARRSVIIGTALALLALIATTGGLILRSRSNERTRSGAVNPPVTLGVETDPPGAEVIRVTDGQVLGKTPWRIEQAAQPGELLVRLRLPGYQEREVLLNLASGGVRPIAMSALPVPPVAGATPEPSPAPWKGGKRGGKARKSEKPARSEPTNAKSKPKAGPGGVTIPIEQ